ncbi:MAG: glycosyltransferase family 2 protein [Planctomycetota bacterium]|nr:glycosyltransferase family 2 protein [Planctomycetota bacterium]
MFNSRKTGVRDSSESTLSILIPAHNEAVGLKRLLPMVFDVLDHWPNAPDYEVIVVDDGSGDSTSHVVLDFQVHKPRLKLVRNGSQRGQSTCLAIAARHAVGKWLATLDADGQNDPADIPRLWSVALETGCDAVLGWRENRQDNRRTRWVSKIANRVRNGFLGQSIRDTGCSTRLVKASLIAELPRFEGWHRFLGPMLAARGAEIEQVPVRHYARLDGASHYNWRNRGVRVLIDLLGVAWLNRRPLRFDMLENRQNHRLDDGHDHTTSAMPHHQAEQWIAPSTGLKFHIRSGS